MRHTKNRTRPLDEALRIDSSLCLSWMLATSCFDSHSSASAFHAIRQHALTLVLFLQLIFSLFVSVLFLSALPVCSSPCVCDCPPASRLFICTSTASLFFLLSVLLGFSVLVCCSELFFSGSCDCSWWFVGKFEVYGRMGKKICYVLSSLECSSCRREFVGSASRRLQYHCGVQSCNAARPQHQRVTLSQSIKNPLHVLGHILDPRSAYLEFSTQHAALLCRHPYYCLYFVASVIEFTAILFLHLISVMKSNRYSASMWLAFFPITQTHQFLFLSFPMSQWRWKNWMKMWSCQMQIQKQKGLQQQQQDRRKTFLILDLSWKKQQRRRFVFQILLLLLHPFWLPQSHAFSPIWMQDWKWRTKKSRVNMISNGKYKIGWAQQLHSWNGTTNSQNQTSPGPLWKLHSLVSPCLLVAFCVCSLLPHLLSVSGPVSAIWSPINPAQSTLR